MTYEKIACISTVALLITAQMPVNALTWRAVEIGITVVGGVCWVGHKIVGEIIYTESCYVENTTLWYYGYYKNIKFWAKRQSIYNPTTDTTSYFSWSMHPNGTQRLDNNDPFPLEPSLRDNFCDYSTTDENGKIMKTTYKTFEVFKFAVENKVVSERGFVVRNGPYATRLLWNVAPLFKNCFTSESEFPKTDYLDVDIPKNGGLYGLTGNLWNRKYIMPYFKRP